MAMSIFLLNVILTHSSRQICSRFQYGLKKMFELRSDLSPVHTKDDNYKHNYKDNISIHSSERYHLFVLSAPLSATLKTWAHYSRMDSDWLSMFV